ncbi:MAG: prepilin-type N-terminal cleavage/methylation domain-containing protein [Pseudoflavonifractor sp.]|nr:prepilin-type N-terminal cleavage/methylation domain-containing protein [Pseudoflavonifractor sp.]
MRKKCRSRGGFTASEMLVAAFILGLIALAFGAGILAAVRVYQKVSAQAEAGVLCSTLSTAMADELRFAEQPRQSGEEAKFDSTVYGQGVSLDISGGRVWIGGVELVSAKTYTGGLKADKCNVTYADQLFHVELEVGDGNSALVSTGFDVRALNG